MDEDQVEVGAAADRRAETAKASLRSKLHELERRYEAAKDRLDVGARIAQHPRAAVGIAFGIGALLGMLGGRSKPTTQIAGDRSFGKTVMAALGTLAIQALKEAALNEGSAMAKGWWGDRTERDVPSHDPSVEALLEH